MNALKRFLRTPKGTLTALFVPLVVLGSTAVGWQAALPHLLAAVLGAALMELVVERLSSGRWAWPSSAILSGLIVGFVLVPQTATAITATIGVLATLGKHIVRTQRWHVFNP